MVNLSLISNIALFSNLVTRFDSILILCSSQKLIRLYLQFHKINGISVIVYYHVTIIKTSGQ